MIAAWMLYCVAIAVALVAAGYALERGLYLAGWPTRWAWVAALAASLAIPAASWLRPDSFATLTIPAAQLTGSRAGVASDPTPNAESIAAAAVDRLPGLGLAALDSALRWAWAVSSGAVLLLLATAGLRLAALRRGWRRASIAGRTMWVSDNVGPAVTGLLPPQVVIPSWVLTLDEERRRLVLTHEEEHVRAGDPWLLAAGTAALLLAPWNVALWWIVRRLRLAVEIDCDARVLQRGYGSPEYGDLLLHVGRRLAHLPLGAAALGEPRSFLEHRIRRMSVRLPRRRWLGAGVAATVAGIAIVGACEAPRPGRPEVDETEISRPTAVFSEAAVDERPELVSAPVPTYPALLKTAGIQGVVLVEVIVDTSGRAEPRSLKVISSPHVGFNEGVLSLVAQASFRPARVNGRAVRVRTLIPFRFHTDIPPINLQEKFDPRDYTGTGVEGGIGTGVVPDAGQVYAEAVVEEKPEMLSRPVPEYPQLLRTAGIEGTVIVQVIVDTMGRAEPNSIKVVRSPNPGLDQPVKSAVQRALFRPGRVHGRAVRVLVQIRYNFALKR